MKHALTVTGVIAAVSLAGCTGTESDFPEVDGWTREGEVLTYDADNLWEYINGAAELFVDFDVQTCRTADLSSGDLTATVDLYDMGSPLNAFGVFNRESPDQGISLPGATAAVISPPYQALMLKGATYVKVNAVEGELTDESGRNLLAGIAASLPGQAGLPSELDLLPETGKVPNTEGYQRRGFLGLAELTNCVYADYAGEGEATWQGFVVLPIAASAVWEVIEGEWRSIDHDGAVVLYREVPYVGLVGVTRTDTALVGASGAADEAELLSRLSALLE